MRARGGHFEVLFARPDGLLTEGSFTNLFVERDGRLLTPPLARGLLPGDPARAAARSRAARSRPICARPICATDSCSEMRCAD